MKSFPICFLGLMLLLFVSTPSVKGVERVFDAANFAVMLPSGWEEVKDLPQATTTANQGTFRSPDHKRIVIFMTREDSQVKGEINERFVRNFELGCEKQSSDKRISSRYLKQAGIRIYERVGVQSVNGKEFSTFSHVFTTDGWMYQILAMRYGGSATEDEEIQSVMSSFRFLVTPQIQVSSLNTQSPEYQLGYLIGRLTAYGAFVGVAIVGIIFAVTKVRRSANRGGKATGSKPPPLPR